MIKNQDQPPQKLSLFTKLIYGSGDWSMASFNTIRQIFYAIFLTDTVGLRPQLASLAALIGIIWDAINDPLVGSISDSARTKWGRRRPFLLLFSVPFGLAFVLLWWAPPWDSQFLLFLHVTLAFMLADTLQTLVVVPFLTLTPELTQDYDERTSLTTFRMLFNLLASLAAAAGAPEIVASFSNRQTGYLFMSAIFGALSIFPYILIFITTRERFSQPTENQFTPLQSFTSTWKNIPFRIATVINLLNWVTS
jgi:GPH family glycoside/pentoside/hexuronide:cation symporter